MDERTLGGPTMQPMTCKNCLAPINPHLDHCEYCGGYFEKPVYIIKPSNNKVYMDNLYNEALKAMRNYTGIVTVAEDVQIMTPNEMRATVGLDPFTGEYMFDDVKQQYIFKTVKQACEKPKKKLFGFGR